VVVHPAGLLTHRLDAAFFESVRRQIAGAV